MKITLWKALLCLTTGIMLFVSRYAARPACAGTEALPQKPLIAYRLDARQLAALNAADRVQVSCTVMPAKQAVTTPETTLTSKMQPRAFLNAFRAALRDDHPYAAAYQSSDRLPQGLRSIKFALFNAGQDTPALDVMFYHYGRDVYVSSFDAPVKGCQPGYFIISGLFSPRVLTLMKQAFPDTAQVQALQSGSPPVSANPLQIPPDVLKTAAMLHPGMTRADLLRVYRVMGGLSTPHQRTYYMDGVSVPLRVSKEVTGKDAEMRQTSRTSWIVRVDAWFAPRRTPLRWIDGVGIPLDPNAKEYLRLDEQPDDIITYLSAPYLGGLVAD